MTSAQSRTVSALDLEAEYNNRKRVPGHPAIIARWITQSERARADCAATLGIAYGLGERQRYDLFHAAGNTKRAATIIFIHGGYWAALSRNEFSFVARAFVAQGFDVVIPSYSLCPSVSVNHIIGEMRMFLAALHRATRQRVMIVGHSAGGQLGACMLATDWSRVPGMPAALVTAVYSISGVFDLEPLISTSINNPLQLDAASARAASPLYWPAPRAGALVAAVGALESSEFLRQSRAIAEAWRATHVTTEFYALPGADHFTVLDPLMDPASPMAQRIIELAQADS